MENAIVVVGIIGVIALAKTIVNLLQYLAATLRHEAGAVNGLLTMVIALLAGIFSVGLYSMSILANTVPIPGTKYTLANVDFGAIIILGVAVGSIATVVVDFIKARDASDSAKKPKLIPPPEG